MAKNKVSDGLEQLYPQSRNELADKAATLTREASRLEGKVHPILAERLKKMVMFVSCYYANLIDNRQMHPFFVEQAFKGDYQDEPGKRDMQLLSRAHVKMQQMLEEAIQDNPGLNVSSKDFLKWMHTAYYRRVPKKFRGYEMHYAGKKNEIGPGDLNEANMQTSEGKASSGHGLESPIDSFSSIFDSSDYHGSDAIIAAALSHYQFMQLQPFSAGNNQIARFYTHSWFIQFHSHSRGLWSFARGVARKKDEYFNFFPAKNATMRSTGHDENRSESSGSKRSYTGQVSDNVLATFCDFFLTICLEQIRFMDRLLEPDHLLARIHKYISLRSVEMDGLPVLRDEVRFVLEAVVLRGSVARGEIARISGLGERTARAMTSSLLNEGLLESDNHKAPVRLGIPTHVIGWWFPKLYPEGII